MERRFILHIGMPKTGTTTIQALLASMDEALLTAGVLYPKAGRPEAEPGHHVLSWAFTKRHGPADESCWRDMLEEVRSTDPGVVVLSSEDLSFCSTEQVRAIREYLGGSSVEVVIYLRNPLSFLVSAYKQNVKGGKCDVSFRAFLEERVYRCDYGRILAPWEDVFGREAMRLRIYDKVLQAPGIEEDIIDIIGLAPEWLRDHRTRRRWANVSPPDDAIRLLKELNVLNRRLAAVSPASTMINRARRSVITQKRFGRALVACARPFTNRPLYREEDVEWLREAIRERTAAFLDTYIPREDRPFFEF
jgi:hypothetical protein